MRQMRAALMITCTLCLAVAPLSTRTAGAATDPELEHSIAQKIQQMSEDEKLAQLMVVGFSGTSVNAEVDDLLARWKVGAIALFSRNVKSPEQVRRLTRGMRDVSKAVVAPFIAIDQEGGLVVRLKQGVSVLPGAMALGATRSRTLAYLAGRAVGADLRGLGISMNFAPVLDVNSNPANPVIGTRSLGERPELVAELGRWFIRGEDEAGIISVAKHFPGHGDTQLDSHYATPSLSIDLDRLRKLELVPFEQAIAFGLSAIMTAHIALPKVSEEPSLPATLSPRVLTGILRKDLGFDGLVITDGLEMRGIVEGEGIGRAAVKALNAGADMVMVLWSQKDREDVFSAMKGAYLAGELSHERVDASLTRIFRVKHKAGLFDKTMSPESLAAQRVLHDQVAEEIAERSVTLVRDRTGLMPLYGPGKRTRVLYLGPEGQLAQSFMNDMIELMPSLPTKEQRQKHAIDAIARSAQATVIVAAAQNRYHVEVIRQVREALPSVPMAFVSLGSPYYLAQLPTVDAYLCAYGDLPSSQRALARVLHGERGTVGRLPVTIPGHANYGDGIVLGAVASDDGAGAAGSLALSDAGITTSDAGSRTGGGLGSSKKAARIPR
ncbi:MAG: beta-N-acetylhexosaminidase [Deltaproteobacteria bacterium]|nr:beta-N-acetylhexosaminidase [Deltaproteobacteria bacterium]